MLWHGIIGIEVKLLLFSSKAIFSSNQNYESYTGLIHDNTVSAKKRSVVKNGCETFMIFPGRPEIVRGVLLVVIHATCPGPHIPPVIQVSTASITEQQTSKLSSKTTILFFRKMVPSGKTHWYFTTGQVLLFGD